MGELYYHDIRGMRQERSAQADPSNNELYHYGVKGMRWGKHKATDSITDLIGQKARETVKKTESPDVAFKRALTPTQIDRIRLSAKRYSNQANFNKRNGFYSTSSSPSLKRVRRRAKNRIIRINAAKATSAMAINKPKKVSTLRFDKTSIEQFFKGTNMYEKQRTEVENVSKRIIDEINAGRINLKHSDHLEHHGIIGMHWGIRRYQPYGQGYTPTHKGKNVGEAAKSKSEGSSEPSPTRKIRGRHPDYQQAHRQSLKTMSNEDAKNVRQRLNYEDQILDYRSKRYPGERAVRRYIAAAATVAAIGGATAIYAKYAKSGKAAVSNMFTNRPPVTVSDVIKAPSRPAVNVTNLARTSNQRFFNSPMQAYNPLRIASKSAGRSVARSTAGTIGRSFVSNGDDLARAAVKSMSRRPISSMARTAGSFVSSGDDLARALKPYAKKAVGKSLKGVFR